MEKSGIFVKKSVVRMFCEMHNSSVELKGILLEKSGNCVMFEIKAGSLLQVEGSVFVRNNEMNGNYVRNGGTFWLINTSLGVGNGQECGMMGSVVKMEGGDLSSLFVRNSEFEDVVFCGGGGGFLRDGSGSFEFVQNCKFVNITKKFSETEEIQTGKERMMKMSSMEDCDVERSMNVLEGGIVSGTEGSGSFFCNNCTFVRNERVDREVRNANRVETTKTQTFTNAEWIECNASCGGALYVHDNSSATLTVENSSFVKCNATSERGGGIFALNIGECTVKHSTFIECYCVASSNNGGAGMGITGMTIQVLVDNCLFKDNWSGNDGGGLIILSSKTNKTKDCVFNCYFQNCSGNKPMDSDGGGFIHWYAVDKIVAHNCLFQGCHSDLRGGAVSILTNGYSGNLLWFCFFHNNTASYGNDINLEDNSTDSQVAFCYSTRTDGNRYYAGGDKSNWLPNEGGRSRFVASRENQTNAKDTFSCGLNESYACSTISHCLSQMIVGFVEEIKVLSGTVMEGKGINVGEKTITVNGASPAGSSIETKFERNGLSLFCVGTGKLSVNDLSVIHNTSYENNRQCKLFEVEGSGLMDVKRMNVSMDSAHSEERSIQNSLVKLDGGELKMQDVRWEQTFSTTSVISLSQESSVTLSLDNCVFSNIVRTTAGSSLMSVSEGSHSITFDGCAIDGCGNEDCEFGGGMMVEVGNIGSLTMNGGVVRNCYASTTQGRGGGIGLKVKDTNAEFQISSGFEGNSAKWGNDIFIDSPNLEATAKSRKITSFTASISTINKIRGFHNGDETIPIPLCVYLIPLPSEIVVSNADAFDHSRCGFAEFPCLTLKHSLEMQEEEKKIVVDGMIAMEDELTFDSLKHTIRGKDGNSGWKVGNEQNGVKESLITVSANTNLSLLIFSVPSGLANHEIFFSSSSQSFSLESCSLTFQNSRSALSFVFLSVTAGEMSVSSFVVSSLVIGNHPLISLEGNNAAGTFTSMIIEDIFSDTQSVLFGIANGASFSIQDSTLSVKTASQAESSSSGSIRMISTYSVKLLKLTNNTMRGFKGDGGNGGAVECMLGRDCSLEIVGGMMSGCESKGGNGGGMWVEMGEGSRFTVGNMTNANKVNEITSNEERGLFQLVSCKATQTADGECGYGGGIYLHLADGTSSFTLKDVSFSACDAKEGKEVFINANDLSSVIDRISIGFGVDMSDLTKLNGFERSTSNETFAIPLVVYLWNNFSAPVFVGGGSLSHDFSKCGFEEFPCSSISKAVSIHFEGKKKDVALLEPFVFEEELGLTSNEWSIASKEDEMKCDVCDQKEGAQSGLIKNTVSVSVTGIVFSLKKSLTFHESVFECHSGKLTLNGCGMEGGTETITTVFVKAVEGVVEVSEFSTKDMKIGDSSIFVVEGNAESVPSMNMTHCDFSEITFGDGCVVECHEGIIEEMSGCTFSSITRMKGSGGCISIANEEDDDDDGRDFKAEIDDCTFEGCAVAGEEGTEIGGGALFCEASSKTNLLISLCSFYCCRAPYEEGSIGYGGGIMLKILKQEEEGKAGFVISSPVFSSGKPNNAKYGKDLFISSASLAKSVKNETLPFVKDRLEMLTEDSLMGYDGGNKECAIPLIYFWREIESSVHIAEEGNNVVVCGFPNLPCQSVDYGMNRIGSSTVEHMMIHGVCDVRSVIGMNGMKLEGTNGESDKIRFVQALEGDGDVVVECKGIVQFKEVGILIPGAFDNGANILIQTDSDAIETSIVSCSIHQSGDAEGELSFVLICAVKGIVEIENTEIAGFSTMHEIMSISADCVTTMNNVTFEDISLSGKSAIAMSESVLSAIGNDNEGEIWNIQFEQCTFVNVKNSASNNPSLLCCDEPNEVRLKMENSTIDNCGSTSSNEGGGVFFLLNEKGRLEMNRTNVTECFCSNIGRGGGLFLKSQSVSLKALPFVLSNITFLQNVASKGRDVFVKCTDLDSQISESQFLINFGEPFVRELAIWGCTSDNYGDEEDLLRRVFVFRSEFIFVSSIVENSSYSKQCGEMKSTCSSLNVGVSHIIPSDYSQLLIWNETELTGSCSAEKVTIKSMEASRNGEIKVNEINLADEGAVRTSESVRFEKVSFVFCGMGNVVCLCLIRQLNGSLILESVSFLSESGSMENSQTLFDFSLIVVEDGLFEAEKCIVGHLIFSKAVFNILRSEKATFEGVGVDGVECKSSLIECGKSEKVSISKLAATNIELEERSLISLENSHSSLVLSLVLSSFTNISRSSDGSCIVCSFHPMSCFEMCNCSFHECTSESPKGSQVAIALAEKILIESCVFEGNLVSGTERNEISDEVCKWNGSVVDLSMSEAVVRDTTICNSSKGGMSVSGGTIIIKDGRFENNNPSIEKYPSARRNIICSDSASLTISSLKGGDGVKDNSSLWILNEGCNFEGIISERSSPFFIPVLENVSVNENGSNIFIKFKGYLFIPCDLSFRLVFKTGDVELVETYPFEEDCFASELEVVGRIPSENISTIAHETEVSVMILFGKQLAATSPQIVKNKTEPNTGNDKAVEGGKEGKTFWPIIVIVMAIILFIVLIVSIVLAVRWRKVKNEAEDLREIVNDNIRKDPKAFEMVTMEMSPEEQWRRAEREAEKKNEERIKKRVYEKTMEHSESSEHLLSESGSTEYILGRDSDKIPEWALEKVDEKEEEETRKITPSPSISSTSTTDSDSTFVRSECLCPTTSSMSNLVDAMACSSPHEKLIVDLRDSLFMLLHGRNEKKEMEIGSLKEREQTAAQVLFWVANGALHSFDEMENPLQSLSNLSPHIVLFSEHMVICIALHSDCSSDSDSSSISSMSIVSSSSNISAMSERFTDSPPPSSAFEDEDNIRKECLRWKAPELMVNKKMDATKETVAFSIGMMLWECLTLEVPFGEYEAEAAGQKIVNGERPISKTMLGNKAEEVIDLLVSQEGSERPSLVWVKRACIQKFPKGAAVLTVSDAIDFGTDEDEAEEEEEEEEISSEGKDEKGKIKSKSSDEAKY
ncbi:uncharacterized protein MONOS_4506 [Monocercomonoides exilis]|uniref:uncharacterized protein n=1 Tax=Monocercomonoides exilis TaxID=2049356 RepID=UPI00355A15BD|nr:hypothetical protein MONOS_4506 [Monocercomonoides exilis]|eukprot:MONOS_4506.1-p1 / transcript=MONOS_4506.1 / gene=MONOS_4506 / organism=Monocercomonoides_exilis_PA203 / gene_product=unspecified product / transcript_product=unspecified product / location=Mono_scaffold00120:103964-112924(-) / protein_length=2987 / sequence_SO=supercontig / SO=protein_coding / is_pseudo=false